VEVLVASAYVRDCIADIEKVSLLAGAIAGGYNEYGMLSFDQSIFELCQSGAVSVEEAANWVTNVEEFQMRLRGITPGSHSFRR
jgi:twitching motility protein PilT